jgi:RNA polymerase sigma factor (sigma-70 family)
MTEWDDADLIEACLAGDDRAWKILIERYSRLIYTIPLRLGFSRIVADEIFQETCVILLEKLDTLRDRSRLSSWLVTVTRRGCIQRWRQKEPIQVDLTEVAESVKGTPESELLRLEELHQVQLAFERLPLRCQRLLRALFIEDPPRSYEAVATKLDIPLGSVGPTRGRCLEKLRLELAKLESQGMAESAPMTVAESGLSDNDP